MAGITSTAVPRGRHVAARREEEEEVAAVARPLMSAQAGKSRGTGVAAASHPFPAFSSPAPPAGHGPAHSAGPPR